MLNRNLEAWGVFLFFITTLANTSFNIISGEKKKHFECGMYSFHFEHLRDSLKK